MGGSEGVDGAAADGVDMGPKPPPGGWGSYIPVANVGGPISALKRKREEEKLKRKPNTHTDHKLFVIRKVHSPHQFNPTQFNPPPIQPHPPLTPLPVLLVTRKVKRGEHDGFTDGDLAETFAVYGEIARAEMIRDSLTGDHKGYGFVSFIEQGAEEAALEALNGATVCGRKIMLERNDASKMHRPWWDKRPPPATAEDQALALFNSVRNRTSGHFDPNAVASRYADAHHKLPSTGGGWNEVGRGEGGQGP